MKDENEIVVDLKVENIELLYKLGLNKELEEYWKTNFYKYDLGRISSQHRDLYKVISAKGEVLGSISGSLRHGAEEKNEYPAVGDWVAIEKIDRDKVIIKGILPRKTTISRKVAGFKMEDQVIATNIDKIFIAMSLNNDFNLRRIERYINIAWDSGATPIIILTKSDVCRDIEFKLKELEEVAIGIDILTVSSLTGEGIEAVRNNINKNDSAVLIGSSGAGKSTLINRLMGSYVQDTSEIGNHDKGRHTTTHRELLILPSGGIIIDTPGMREIQLSQGDIESTFSDIEEIAKECYFTDCKHDTEPRCAIKDAMEKGIVSKERFESYEKLKRELYYAQKRRESKERSKLKKSKGKSK